MNWMTLVVNALVPLASVISSAAVAIWTKRIDARNRAEDRRHEHVLDFEKRAAADDKKAVLKSLISATMYVKRAAQYEGPAPPRRSPASGAPRPSESSMTSACVWASTMG
jgi:hypothetical protein